MDDDVIVTSKKVFIMSNCFEPTNFVLGTKTQQHNVHLMMKMKVTLTYDEGHRRRSKVTKMNQIGLVGFFFFFFHHL